MKKVRSMMTSVLRQVTDHPMLDIHEGRLAQQVAAEQVAGFDAVGFQEAGQVIAGKAGSRPAP